MTLSDNLRSRLHPLMADYADHLFLRGKDRTALSKSIVLAQFNDWCHEHECDPVAATRDQLEAYQSYLVTIYKTPQREPLARSTASARISQLKSWFQWMQTRGHLVADPSRSLGIRVAISRVVRKEYLDLQEATALVQTQAAKVMKAKPGTRKHAKALGFLAAICLTLATGRRISGIAGMRVDQIDPDHNEVRIEREKGHMGRVLPVAGWAMEVVRWYIAARPVLIQNTISPWLFPNGTGIEPVHQNVLAAGLKALVKATIRENPDLVDLKGKHISWHSLRVSFATLLFQNGADIRSVNELLLHRSLR
jgi:site-specific recombinase XerD